MSSAVAELDGYLQSMLNLKPPGVSGSKITAITNLCNANVQSESVLIQKIFTHFKKTPGTHKLGVLYVVDSVTRRWVDEARKSGQQPGSGALDGTYGAGVNRVTELLPVLMSDIISSAPEDQKPKVKKLLEIWERSSTFPAAMLSSIKDKLDTPKLPNESTTPINSPAPGFVPLGQQQANAAAAPPPQDTSAILEALKNMAKQTATPQPPTNTAASTATSSAPFNLNSFLGAQNTNTPPMNAVNAGNPTANAQGVNGLSALFGNAAQSQLAANAVSNPFDTFMHQQQQPQSQPQNTGGMGTDVQAQMQLVQLMAAQGIPPDQWGTALQLLNMQNQNGNPGNVGAAVAFPGNNWQNGDQSRDRDGNPRSPPNQNRRRSRSPGYDRGRRGSPSYDQYRNDRDGRRGNEYRQRSPAGRRRRSTTPPQHDQLLPPPGPKNVQIDHNLPARHIKVMSRTLFVGGVTSSEQHLRGLFERFGLVQTCIVNVDKRHAFIKMLDRKDAEKARTGMEEYKDGNTQLRTKWGVGFGPRDCSDYQTGISVIPIDRLTDADRKWLLSAEYGGTGGMPIEQGMVVEEPDIEIGAGVSSKAMSRRIPTDSAGPRGPKSSRRGERYRDDDRRNDNQQPSNNNNNNNNNNGPPGMTFPMNFPSMPTGMPMFPPGFPFPFPQQGNQK